jgi:hypothetical protein
MIITANTPYAGCEERLSAFGGFLPLIKMLDLIGFKDNFETHYVRPQRGCELGNCAMVTGLPALLFIGFQRLGHFAYIRQDPMVCGALKVRRLPVVSAFWRYLKSLDIIQSQSLLRLGASSRRRVWEELGWAPEKVSVDIDTTTATVYGNVEGGKKGYNPRRRGKKGLRPILVFLAQSREYLCGGQRRGETLEGKEAAWQIRQIKRQLPECVQEVLVRADGEMTCWESVKACKDEGFHYIFGNKRCTPVFPKRGWYQKDEHEYNECLYQPMGWEMPERFVAMRIRKEEADKRQLSLQECEGYVYRVFVTDSTDKPHKVVACYDLRATVENLIGEAQREGVLAIPSNKFHANHAFFQIVMLAYNLWRWMKMLAGRCENPTYTPGRERKTANLAMPDHTIRLARLKMLYVAAKIQFHAGQSLVRYYVPDERVTGLMDFLGFLDERRKKLVNAASFLTATVQKNYCTVGCQTAFSRVGQASDCVK